MALAMALPYRHPTSGIYWFRRRVPRDLQAILGKSEEKRSLGTRDPAEARRAYAVALAELEDRWANLRQGPKCINEREAHELVAPVYDWWLNQHRDNPSEQAIWYPEHFEALWGPVPSVAELGAAEFILLPLNDRRCAIPAMREFCREQTEALLQRKGLRVGPTERGRVEKALATAIQRASLDIAKLAMGVGEVLGGVDPWAQMQRPHVATRPAVPLQKVLDGWKAERQPMEKTVYEYTRVIRDLKGHLGHDDAAKISPKDLVAWKANMVEAGLTPKTIRDAKLAPVRAMLQWAVDNELLVSNPGSRVTIDLKVRAGDSKRGFDDAEARAILTAAREASDPVRQWVPLLGAYSGARVSELCQLRVEDVVQVEGIWCMKFVPEAGSLKTRGSERLVPLHPAVIDAGFLTFLTKSKPGPLFPDLEPDVFGKRGGNGTKVIGRWVRGLGLTDLRLSPSHSWRHRFKTLGRRHGLMPDIVNAITGHHRKTVADFYGEFPVEALHREISKIPTVGV